MVGVYVALAVAAAAPLVALPPGESEERWRRALALVDLSVGAPAESSVWIEAAAGRWTVRVRDAAGDERSMTVDRPATQREREQVAFLASSLLEPVVDVPLPPAPTPVEPRRRRARPRPESAPLPEPVTPEPVRPLPPPTAWRPPAEPWVPGGRSWGAIVRQRPVAWGAAGLEITGRAGGRPMVGASVSGGLPVVGPWHAVGGVFAGAPSLLQPVDEARTVQMVRGWASVMGAAGRISAGPAVGVSWRRFAEPEGPVLAAWLPDLGLDGMLTVPVGPAAVRVRAHIGWDLVPVDLIVGDASPQRQAPLGWGLGVTFGTRRTALASDTLR